MFRPQVPEPYFSGPGALQNRSGTCLNASGVGISKTISQDVKNKHLGFFAIFLKFLLPALSGEHIFEKRTKTKLWPACLIFNAQNI